MESPILEEDEDEEEEADSENPVADESRDLLRLED